MTFRAPPSPAEPTEACAPVHHRSAVAQAIWLAACLPCALWPSAPSHAQVAPDAPTAEAATSPASAPTTPTTKAVNANGGHLPDLTATPAAVRPPRPRATSFGFGEDPDWQQPISGFSTDRLTQDGIRRLSDLERIQATVGNGAALAGYLDSMSIRGLVIDSTHNYRRDGLPIQGGTRLSLDGIERVEVLEGLSGIQAGQSSPSGLLNLVVKRPKGRLRQATVAADGQGGRLISADLGDFWASGDEAGAADTGWRFNLAQEELRPAFDGGDGRRHTLAAAADTRWGDHDRLEAEIEHNRHVQAGQSALSMTGNRVPSPDDISPRFNINNQAWSQPARTVGTTGSLRWTHRLDADWQTTVHHMAQRLWSDNHAVYGVASLGCYYRLAACDRFAANGDFAVATYDSINEHRRQDVLDARLDGRLQLGSTQHQLTAGVMRNLTLRDLGTAVNQVVGVSNLYNPVDVAEPVAVAREGQEKLRERSNEIYLKDHLQWGEGWHAWLGLRNAQLKRIQTLSTTGESGRTDQRLSTPWLALGREIAPRTMLHVAWGEGVEIPPLKLSTPTTRITRNGAQIPAAVSRQWELGLQAEADWGQWGVHAFAMRRPEINLLPEPGQANAAYVAADGSSRYHGLVMRWHRSWAAYSLDTSWMWLDARREGSAVAALNGQAPVNTPGHALRISQAYRWAVLRGLTGQLDLIEDGPRTADPVTRERLPAWWRVDAALQLQQGWGAQRVMWGLRVTNLLNQRAWVQAPTQPTHVYLVPMQPRRIVASATIDF